MTVLRFKRRGTNTGLMRVDHVRNGRQELNCVDIFKLSKVFNSPREARVGALSL
jgi:hypothetical protein